MTISEQQRHQMHSKLETVLGKREAGILMEHLPPTGWGDVATRRDVEQLGSTLRSEFHAGFAEVRGEVAEFRSETSAEFARVRGEIRTEVASVRGEIAELRSETRTELAGVREEIAELRSETRTESAAVRNEIADLRAETKADLLAVYKAMSRMTWTMTVSMIGTIVGSASFAFTAGMAM